MAILLRPVIPEDAPKLLSIYAYYVRNTTVTFEYEVPSITEFERRIQETVKKFPYLCAEENGDLLGYVYASPFKMRAAYAWAVETSIYVKNTCHHQGVGKRLYTALEAILSLQHITNLNACITYPNPDSITFHERFGYASVAHFHRCGFKDGQWLDMIFMEKFLCPHGDAPKPFIPWPELDPKPNMDLF